MNQGVALAGLKIAVTSPPAAWFGSVDHKFAADMACELRQMGAELLEIDVARLLARDAAYISAIVSDLRAFRPDVALATPNAGYAMLCTDLENRNLFRDVLEIPTVLIWDHGALQFSSLLLGPLPETWSESREGSIERMRAALDHPLWIHYSPDRGHTAVLRELGVLLEQPVHPFLHVAFPAYTRPAPRIAGRTPQITFAGNIYYQGAQELRFRENETLADIESAMLAAKDARPDASLWRLLMEEIGRLAPSLRSELQLSPDSTFFWRFVRDAIVFAGTTHVRLKMLRSIPREIAFHGNFVEPQMREALRARYGFRMGRVLDCVRELPWLYRNSEILVDAVHPCYISGISPKINSCFAAGGLALFDYRQEFRDAMGDIGDCVMYRDTTHLNALIDGYLTAPRRREEIAGEMQARVLKRFTFAHLMRRILVDEPEWRGTPRRVRELTAPS